MDEEVRYIVGFYTYSIREVKITREDNDFIWIGESRYPKKTGYEITFDTRSDADKFLNSYLKLKIKKLIDEINELVNKL